MKHEHDEQSLSQQTDTEGRPKRSTIDILKYLREGRIRPGDIGKKQRRGCVAYLRLEGYTQDEIAEILGVCPRTIARDEKANRQELGKLVDTIDVRAMAGGHIAWAKHLVAKAIKDKDFALAWRIQRELIADLQSLGYLPKAAEKHALQVGTFVDLVQLAIEQVPQEQQSLLPADDQETDDGSSLEDTLVVTGQDPT